MEENTERKQSSEEEPEFSKIVLGLGIAILVLGGIIYAAYTYSQRKTKKTVYPAGYPIQTTRTKDWTQVDCTKDKYNPSDPWPYVLKCDRFKTDASTKWIFYADKGGRFSIQIPSNLKYVEYPNGIGIIWKDVPPQLDLLFNIDIASSRSGEYKTMKGQDYVSNYWKQFPGGFAGVKSMELIKNSNDVTGYKAIYSIPNNVAPPGTDVFFPLSPDSGDFVHFATGAMDDTVFNTIVGSFKMSGANTPTVTK